MRYLFIFILIIVLILLIILLIKLLQPNPRKQIEKNLRTLFKDMEKEYEKIIRQKLDFEIIKNENLNIDTETIVKNVEPLLKPYLEAMFALLSSNHIETPLSQPNDIKYFKSLYFVAQRFLAEKLPLTQLEKDELFQTFNDALKADVAKRILQLQTGI